MYRKYNEQVRIGMIATKNRREKDGCHCPCFCNGIVSRTSLIRQRRNKSGKNGSSPTFRIPLLHQTFLAVSTHAEVESDQMFLVDSNHFDSPHKNWNQGSLWIILHLKDAPNNSLRFITNLMDLVKCSSTLVNFSIPCRGSIQAINPTAVEDTGSDCGS